MTIEVLKKYREEKLNFIKDQEGFVSEESFSTECLYFMNLAKLIDTDEFYDSYFENKTSEGGKINGYLFNDTGERLHIFIVNFPLTSEEGDIIITKKEQYSNIIGNSQKLLISALNGKAFAINESEPIKPLLAKLATQEGLEQIDTIEIFLLSNTISADSRGGDLQLKKFIYPEEEVLIKQKASEYSKTIKIQKTIIDNNFLYRIETSKEPREPIEIRFEGKFGKPIFCLKAADEENYSSYLAVISGPVLCAIYGEYSNRLLEKNVRGFLQFRGAPKMINNELKGGNANARMRHTIKEKPERFLAYNNGLTITASNVEFIDQNGTQAISSLSDFQIVNGGQTTASLYFTAKEKISVEKVNVSAKINILKSQEVEELEDLIKYISVSSNTQTKVSTVDLSTRNPHLQKIKELSEKCVSPNGNLWFFEKSRGEFYTVMHKAGPSNKFNRKNYDKKRLLSKEQIAKYYVAWGDRPFLVKKGGEKVFKDFTEILADQFSIVDSMKESFFENLVAKAILFTSFHNLYGERNNSIGQIRSATVPYSIACLYNFTKQEKDGPSLFNLKKIWVDQGVDIKLKEFAVELMKTINKSILSNHITNDINEDTKKETLWKKVKEDKLVTDFFNSLFAKDRLKDYLLPKDQVEKEWQEAINEEIAEISAIEPSTWFSLAKWAKDNEQHNPTERKFLFDVGKYLTQGRSLSIKQVKWAKSILEKSIDSGFIIE